MQDLKGLDYMPLIIPVSAESIILAELFQELDRRLIIGDASKDTLPTLGPRLRGSQDDRSV
jgi:hypothetical protein